MNGFHGHLHRESDCDPWMHSRSHPDLHFEGDLPPLKLRPGGTAIANFFRLS